MTVKLKQSKRYTLNKLAPNWRETMFQSIKSERLKLAVAVLSATGCRPSELEMGVAVRLRDGVLSIGIQGSKVDQQTGRGQPLRLLEIDSITPWGSYLMQWVSNAEGGAIVVQYDAEGVSQRLREKSRELWPRRKSLVSAYSYRHFIGKSMKESGEIPDKIAATLGHASDFSQHVYGRAGGGKKIAGKHGIVAAAASNPIRHSSKIEKLSKLITRMANTDDAAVTSDIVA
jgi:integrase